jgi:hypothetical protein
VQREIDAIGLRAVTQRRIEQIKPLTGHDDVTKDSSSRPAPPRSGWR